ncbi:IclR family transcriptional regulator [Salicibibacter cibarius]|uniref:IclR family transcriptional regulator n=1 Tax=Salicibibacter cibarius TaxID=2743000 RepID=A0A7T7CAL3_9BACI|nr:IclR family transcriptional regulator [Salicibibacter cibarius]QQK74973.1 IclR family transcriptional regulator [Salicibibacter cibarius]
MSQVLEKTALILNALKPTEHQIEWSATELSKDLNIPIQTLHRLLISLSKHGFVYRNDETKKFKLGLNLMELGLTIRDNLSVRNLALPEMRHLSELTNESVYLTIPEGPDGIFIECMDSPQLLKIVEPVGMRRPLHKGGSKKVILAYLNKWQQDKVLNELSARYQIKDMGIIRDDLLEIKKNGYAISHSETTEGTTSIASPIFSWEDEVLASISIAGPDSRFKENRMSQLIQQTKACANRVSEELGWIKANN